MPVNAPEKIRLIVAASAADLAKSARKSGHPAISLDWFGDSDTLHYSLSSACVGQADCQSFDEERLLAAANTLAPQQNGCELIYGSGLDCNPELLVRLAAGRCLLGNPPATLRLIKDPRQFFPLLQALSIPHPETRFFHPENRDNWLYKPACGEGGSAIIHAPVTDSVNNNGQGYFQRNISGIAGSLLFLANKTDITVIGHNTQWVSPQSTVRPYRFGGAINRPIKIGGWQRELCSHATRLTRHLELQGLNTLDYILKNDRALVLELNARPGASFSLYDDDYPLGLIERHRLTCLTGNLPLSGAAGPVRAMQIIYAPYDIITPSDLKWPVWSSHRPRENTLNRQGNPICSVKAAGTSIEETMKNLRQNVHALSKKLGIPPPSEHKQLFNLQG